MTTNQTIRTAEAIEAIVISEAGEALVAMVDLPARTEITIERQADAGDFGIFGWEGNAIAYYQSRGWNADTETVFREGAQRYVTFNLSAVKA